MGTSRLESIQALRALGAGMVFLAHAEYFLSRAIGRTPADQFLTAGVDLFFVVSGYVMTMLAGSEEDRACGPAAGIRFMARRIARLIPVYWLVLGYVALANTLQGGGPDGWQLLSSLLLVPHVTGGAVGGPILAVSWSLNYEMFFYVVMAAAAALRLGQRGSLALATAALAGTWLADRLTGHANPWLHYYGDQVIFLFPLGGLLAIVLPRIRARGWSVPALLVAALGALVAVVAMATGGWGCGADACTRLGHGNAVWAAGAVSVCAGAILCEDLVGARAWRAVSWFGDLSYSFYLVHFSVVVATCTAVVPLLLQRLPVAAVVAVEVGLAWGLSTVISAALYRFVERPGNRAARAALARFGQVPALVALQGAAASRT